MDIYADCNATTPLSEGVLEAMLPYLGDIYGNASSRFHRRGAIAGEALSNARLQLATLLGASPEQVVCTSGGTESCFLAFLGVLRASRPSSVLITVVEHPAVVESAALLAAFAEVPSVRLAVDAAGAVDLDAIDEHLAVHPRTLLSVMLANNETGILFPVREIVEIARSYEATIHCDATQVVGKMPIDFTELGVDLLSLSAHKFGGPKGVGALLVRDAARWLPVMSGGGQEAGRRGGTEAVAQVVGMGQAAAIKQGLLADGLERSLAVVRDAFEARLDSCSQDSEGLNVEFHGAQSPRLPNTSSVYVPEVSAIKVRDQLAAKGIVVSTGSACATSHATASPVLQAMGRSPIECLSVFRVSFGIQHTTEDAELVADHLIAYCLDDRKGRREEVAEALK